MKMIIVSPYRGLGWYTARVKGYLALPHRAFVIPGIKRYWMDSKGLATYGIKDRWRIKNFFLTILTVPMA